MEPDYDAILSHDFSGIDHDAVHGDVHHEHHDAAADNVVAAAAAAAAAAAVAQQSTRDGSVPNGHGQPHSPDEGEDDPDHLDVDRRRGAARHLGNLTAEERKARQKAQNRKAAERSRMKKKDEL